MYSTHTAHATLLLLVALSLLTSLSVGCIEQGVPLEEPHDLIAHGSTFEFSSSDFPSCGYGDILSKCPGVLSTITQIKSFHPDIISVEELFDSAEDFESPEEWEPRHSLARLKAHKEGVAVIEVITEEGERAEITYKVNEAVDSSLRLQNPNELMVLQDTPITLSSINEDVDGQWLNGQLPLSISGGAVDTRSPLGADDDYVVTFHDSPAVYTLTLNTGSEAKKVQVVTAAQIDGLETWKSATQYFVHGMVGDEPVAGAPTTLTAKVTGNERCRVTAAKSQQGVRPSFYVESVSPSNVPTSCTFEITWPEGNNGQGVSLEVVHKP